MVMMLYLLILLNKMSKLKLTITMGDDHEINLGASTMNEMVEKLIEWQLWENQPLDWFESKEGRLEAERNSGWYYFKDDKK